MPLFIRVCWQKRIVPGCPAARIAVPRCLAKCAHGFAEDTPTARPNPNSKPSSSNIQNALEGVGLNRQASDHNAPKSKSPAAIVFALHKGLRRSEVPTLLRQGSDCRRDCQQRQSSGNKRTSEGLNEF